MSLRDLAVPPLRLRLRHVIDASTEKLALKAALTAAHLLGLAAGSFLRQLRGSADPLAQAAARIREAEIKAALAWDIVEILRARLGKIPDRHRPYYTPAQRFRILEIKNLLGWSRDLAARVFGLCSHTIGNWDATPTPRPRPSAQPSSRSRPCGGWPTSCVPPCRPWSAPASEART